MFSLGASEEWQRLAHGPRVQIKALSFIAKQLKISGLFADEVKDKVPTMTEIFKDCHQRCVPDVSVTTIRRWWNTYEEWGEIPAKVIEGKKRFNMKYRFARKN